MSMPNLDEISQFTAK